jgi:hypothetical protein
MRHFASPAFWQAYEKLPAPVRELADKNYALLKTDPQHPSLRLKKVGRYWSVRVACAIARWRPKSTAGCCGFGSDRIRTMMRWSDERRRFARHHQKKRRPGALDHADDHRRSGDSG